MTVNEIFGSVYYLLDLLELTPFIKAGAIMMTGMVIVKMFWGRGD